MKRTRHPLTGEWDDAEWMDNYFGHHEYGVRFPSGEVFNPREHEIETREILIASVEIGSTPEQDMEVGEVTTERKDVVIQVNALNVEGDDEATQKAKEVIETEVFPRLTNADVVVTVTYREPIDGKFLFASKTVKIPHVRKYAESCVEAFKQQFVPHASDEDFVVVEYYKLTDEVKVTTLHEVRAQ